MTSVELEKVAKKRKTEKDAVQKPVFLTKEQREKEALDRLHKQRQEKEKNERERDRARIEFERRERMERRGRRTDADKKERQLEREMSHREKEEQREKELIKQDYLGKKRVKKVVIPPSQKFKFSFDWEACEDTSVEHNGLYNARHKISMQYGRGFMAGIDRREQRKHNQFYDELIKDRDMGRTDALIRDISKQKERESREQRRKREAEMSKMSWQQKKLTTMTDRDWRIMKQDTKIALRGSSDKAKLPNPLRKWSEAELTDSMEDLVVRMGFRFPTPTQQTLIPLSLRNLDYVAIVEESSGKTAALTIPVLARLEKAAPAKAGTAKCVIITESSSRANKISTAIRKSSKLLGIRTALLLEDSSVLENGAEILVATPNSLMSAIKNKDIELSETEQVFVRETDHILADKTSAKNLSAILDALPRDKKKPKNSENDEDDTNYSSLCFLSGKHPPELDDLVTVYCVNPVFATVGDIEAAKGGRTIVQRVEWMDEGEDEMKRRMRQIFATEEGLFIVICNSKRMCEDLARHASDKGGMSTTVLHGGKSTEQVRNNSDGFKDGKFDVAFITHDMIPKVKGIRSVKQVLNYQMPSVIDKYIARVGLTGMDGARGVVTSFITEKDSSLFYDLKSMLKACKQDIPQKLAKHPASRK